MDSPSDNCDVTDPKDRSVSVLRDSRVLHGRGTVDQVHVTEIHWDTEHVNIGNSKRTLTLCLLCQNLHTTGNGGLDSSSVILHDTFFRTVSCTLGPSFYPLPLVPMGDLNVQPRVLEAHLVVTGTKVRRQNVTVGVYPQPCVEVGV